MKKISCIILSFLTLLIFHSCEKETLHEEPGLSSIEKRFLNISLEKSAALTDKEILVEKIIANLEQQNETSQFIETFVSNYGYPSWDNTRYFETDKEKVLQIPVVNETDDEIKALIIGVENGDKRCCYFIARNDYDRFKNNTEPKLTISRIINLFILEDFKIFGKSDDLPNGVVYNEHERSQLKSGIITEDCDYLAVIIGGELQSLTWRCERHIEYFEDESMSGGGSSDPDPTTTPTYNEGGGDANGISPTPAVVIDPTFENSKADCLKTELEAGGSNSILNKLLEGFKLEKSNIDIVYRVEDKIISSKTGEEINGKCTPPIEQANGRLKITIAISQDRMNSQSFLETARTLLHETFHAHLFGMLKDKDLYNSLDEIDFKTTWEKYKETYPDETQHNWMADNYIEYMKEGLEKLYNNWDFAKRTRFENHVNDIEYGNDRDLMFTCLAWQGLLGKDHNKTTEGAKFYEQNGTKYEAMHQNIISMLTKDCPFE